MRKLTRQEISRRYYEKHKEKRTREHAEWVTKNRVHLRKYSREWRKRTGRTKDRPKGRTPEERLKRRRELYAFNPTRKRNSVYEWRRRNPLKTREIARRYLARHPEALTALRLRIRLHKLLAYRGVKKLVAFRTIIGCSVSDLRIHLERQFTKGMNWDNYGKWHIDHIIPCAAFDLTRIEEQNRCFHFSNLQPL